MRVLLIEPDTKLAKTYEQALSAAKHLVVWAPDAQSAVHASDNLKPDIVVLELQLSAHNGIEFIYEFRSYSEWQSIPIILLTMVPPHALQITEAMLKQFNIIDCLYKPATSLRQLLRAIEESS